MNMSKPLEGITVIEIGTSIAAPYAGLILADLGARVVKVENPDGGDYSRTWGPPFWGDTSSTYHALNRGKESITVDLGREDDRAMLRQLVLEHADAVIQNLRPGILDKFGLGGAGFTAQKPALIWCDIGAFGQVGPMKNKPGYDPLAQAASGIMSVTGEAGREPVRVGVSLIDMGSGMWTVIGLLTRLLERSRSGLGGCVSTSLFETGLAWMTVPLSSYEASGQVGHPHGSGIANIVPYQAFKTRDAWLMIAAGNDGLFRKLCQVLDCPELVADPDYAGNPGRVVNRDPLLARLAPLVLQFGTDELAALLDQAGVPNAPLLTVDRVAVHPQTLALKILACQDGDKLPLMGMPLSFDGQRPRQSAPAPALGQHTDAWRQVCAATDPQADKVA